VFGHGATEHDYTLAFHPSMASDGLPAVPDDPDVETRRDALPFEERLRSQRPRQTGCAGHHTTGLHDSRGHPISK